MREPQQIIEEIDSNTDPQDESYYGHLVMWSDQYNSEHYNFGIGLSATKVFFTGVNDSYGLRVLDVIQDCPNLIVIKDVILAGDGTATRNEVIRRLRVAVSVFCELRQEYPYDYFKWNSEHLARLVATRKAHSYTTNNFNIDALIALEYRIETIFRQRIKETVIEKEKIEQTLQEYIDENLRMKMKGEIAPNKPVLSDATAEDEDIVARNYKFHPDERYDIGRVQKISNPFLSQQFEMYKQILQERFSNNKAFSPKPHWKGYTLNLLYPTAPADTEIKPEQIYLYIENGEIKFKAKNWAGDIEVKTILDSVQSATDKQFILAALNPAGPRQLTPAHTNIIFSAISKYDYLPQEEWRQTIHQFFTELATPFKEDPSSAVSQLLVWHGMSSQTSFQGVISTGFANLATTDPGFFGKGIYGTTHAEYAKRVYAQPTGTLVLNKVAYLSGFPVIKTDKFNGSPNYGNYDAHFVLVSPRNSSKVNYDATPCNQLHTYTELVVFHQAATLPCYLVTLQPRLPTQPSLISPAEQAYEVGEACSAKQPLVAYYYFMKAKQQGNVRADVKINELQLLHSGLRGKFGP